MPCTKPLNAYKSVSSGKIYFSPPPADVPSIFMSLPCGQCIACRLNHSRQWATRMVHENHMHEASCFLTLTCFFASIGPQQF